MIEYAITTFLGTIYGFIFGIIPVAGAGTALITVYGMLDFFRSDPYLLVIFTTAIVVSSSIGDSFASIMMNIPGAAGSAASMVDGFPMARRGEGARALSAAITTSSVNGLIYGITVFMFLPFYSKVVLKFAIPEMFAFLVLSMVCVIFVNSHYWFRGILAAMLGIFIGMIGQDASGAARFTGGWYYLRDGVQLIPVMAGVLAMPELFEAMSTKMVMVQLSTKDISRQIRQGIKDSWDHKIDGLRGGAIGALVGLLPGIGGNIVDWLSYGQTVALNKNEKIPFGDGNIKGVIGCEGANNSQKASAYVPTVLFGIPAAPFEAIVMSLFIMVGIELGSPALLADLKFFDILFSSYMWALVLTMLVSFVSIRWVMLITHIPFRIYFWVLLALMIWSSIQYTGYWEDYAMFGICCFAGLLMKKMKLSRAAFIIGFVLSARIESIFLQYSELYQWYAVFTRPISFVIMALMFVLMIYGLWFNRTKINYT